MVDIRAYSEPGTRYDYQLQFSVWDAPIGGDAQVIALGDDVECTTFGGEGTGQACELNYPWIVGDTYRFEVNETESNGGSAITLHVTDLGSGIRRFVGTIRYADRAEFNRFSMFVEDFLGRAPTCIAQDVRSAAFRRAMAKIDGSWVQLTSGYAGVAKRDAKNPGTPACANLAVRQHPAGLEVAIGGTYSERSRHLPRAILDTLTFSHSLPIREQV